MIAGKIMSDIESNLAQQAFTPPTNATSSKTRGANQLSHAHPNFKIIQISKEAENRI
jgi:hypothetical protein